MPVSSLKLVIAGAAGAVRSTVTVKTADSALTLPTVSVALAVKLVSPSGRLVPL